MNFEPENVCTPKSSEVLQIIKSEQLKSNSLSDELHRTQRALKKAEMEISEYKEKEEKLLLELSQRKKQLQNAAEKYKTLKAGLGGSRAEGADWQKRYGELLNEMDRQKNAFQEEVNKLYWRTVAEYENAAAAEIEKLQAHARSDKDMIIKSSNRKLAFIQGFIVVLAVFYFIGIR